MATVMRQETRIVGPARHTPTPCAKPADPACPTCLRFQEFTKLRAYSGAMGIPNSGRSPIGFNGMPHICPRNYPFPWTDPQTSLSASSLDPSDLPCQTVSGSDPPLFHNPLDRDRPTDGWRECLITIARSALMLHSQQRGLIILTSEK